MALRQGCCECLRTASRTASTLSAAPRYARSIATSAFLRTDASTSKQGATNASRSPPHSPKEASPPKPPPLPRPLGLPTAPQKHVKPTLKERTAKMMDQDARMAERKHLVKEASTGYFEDYNKIRHHGGKSWIAPKTLIQEKAALYFPEMEGTSLDTSLDNTTVHTSELLRGKISLVAMLSTRMSEAHVQSYTKPVLPHHENNPDFQLVQINCQENRLKWLLVGLFVSSLRRSVPESQRRNYLVSTQNLEYLREPLEMTNKHLGYVYLTDENCKIRWAAVSFALSEKEGTDEVQALSSCIGVLLHRLRTSKAESSVPESQNRLS